MARKRRGALVMTYEELADRLRLREEVQVIAVVELPQVGCVEILMAGQPLPKVGPGEEAPIVPFETVAAVTDASRR